MAKTTPSYISLDSPWGFSHLDVSHFPSLQVRHSIYYKVHIQELPTCCFSILLPAFAMILFVCFFPEHFKEHLNKEDTVSCQIPKHFLSLLCFQVIL
jgi:hypothetical protein